MTTRQRPSPNRVRGEADLNVRPDPAAAQEAEERTEESSIEVPESLRGLVPSKSRVTLQGNILIIEPR